MDTPARILVVDDDDAVRVSLHRALTLEGYEVDTASGGAEAIEKAKLEAVDLYILDIQMPDIDGLQVCRTLRANGVKTPILMLTARRALSDRVDGLDAGADDYLPKPFELDELLARMRALLRRTPPLVGDQLVEFADLRLNLSTREAFRGDRQFPVTKIEFDLLELFLKNPRQVLPRDYILKEVWNYDFESETNSLAVYVGYLRRKTEEAGESRLIYTVRSIGYALRESTEASDSED